MKSFTLNDEVSRIKSQSDVSFYTFALFIAGEMVCLLKNGKKRKKREQVNQFTIKPIITVSSDASNGLLGMEGGKKMKKSQHFRSMRMQKKKEETVNVCV